jgi:hypothetical protein
MKELSFLMKVKPSESTMPKKAPVKASLWKLNSKEPKSRQPNTDSNVSFNQGRFTEAEMLPLVKREVSALAKQRIKVREPSDFLKIQQRVQTDLDGMNHVNAFFR